MNNKDFFEQNKYCMIKNILSPNVSNLITQYALFDEMNNFSPEGLGQQVPRAHTKYADPMMESLLINLLPIMEENTGLSLYPTYSYYRIYRNGDELEPHVDRESCEISTTLCLGYNYSDTDEIWPIYVDDKPFVLYQGDMLIYRGMELNHYRPPLVTKNSSYHIQCFLHYVDKNGPHSDFKFDKRYAVGLRSN